jgi:hypothetical protein
MAFQDNSGDIILDVVLTDEGRRRLAQGDGTFSIVKFALGDDEINYSLFDTSQPTALQDLSILQTPVLEAFTNNTSLMKSKLVSLTNNNMLYMPVLRLNSIAPGAEATTQGNYVVCVDKRTFDDRELGLADPFSIGYSTDGTVKAGFMYGLDSGLGKGKFIRVDSGIDSNNVTEIDESLIENQFIIEMDHRLGQLMSVDGREFPTPSVDDDYVATYTLTRTAGSSFIINPGQEGLKDSDTPIDGPVAASLQFKIRSSQDLRVSDFLFGRIGSTTSSDYVDANGDPETVKYIDSVVRVSGRTTGYSIDIPVRFAKV